MNYTYKSCRFVGVKICVFFILDLIVAKLYIVLSLKSPLLCPDITVYALIIYTSISDILSILNLVKSGLNLIYV